MTKLANLTSKTNQFKWNVYLHSFIELQPGYKNSILLAGSGRSGTTWIADLINYQNQYRYLFEPFNPVRSDLCRGKLTPHKYIRANQQDSTLFEVVESLLSGKVRNISIDFCNRGLVYRKRLIKAICVNLALKWIRANFPEMPIILLLRHPCAVANSRVKRGWGQVGTGEVFLRQKELMNDFLAPFEHELRCFSDLTLFEKYIFVWCIHHHVILKQFKPGEIHLAFYESFCIRPREAIERLFSFIGQRFDDSVFVKLKQPSGSSRSNSAIMTGSNLIDAWKKDVDMSQIHRAVEILNMFGLDKIYSQDSLPNVDNAYRMLAD